MHYIVGKFFIFQWKSIQDMKNESDGVVLKLTRNTMCIKWVPIMIEILGKVIGVRDVPLIYVCGNTVAIDAAMVLLADKTFSEIHCSVRAELIVRVSHDHPVFGDDSGKGRSFNYWKKHNPRAIFIVQASI